MRTTALLLVLLLTSCAADESPIDAPTSAADAPSGDGASTDGGAIDGATTGNGVVCARADQSCTGAMPECCDLMTGTDTCIAPSGPCAGERLECDGPEDCAQGEECCLFDGQGSRCLDEGICGTTGSISSTMCHVVAHCDQGELCCGTAPGPAVDLYGICSSGPCPQ
jgi:hypothetical protein